jgi:hypothetical protein
MGTTEEDCSKYADHDKWHVRFHLRLKTPRSRNSCARPSHWDSIRDDKTGPQLAPHLPKSMAMAAVTSERFATMGI